METFDEVLDAVKKQMEYFVNWHISLVNTWEYVASEHMQLPLLSATIDGCMESGKDVMKGGAKYNSTGNAGIADRQHRRQPGGCEVYGLRQKAGYRKRTL